MLLCGEHYEIVYFLLSIAQGVEQWIVCMPSRVNVFITLATQQHLDYHYKALFLNTLYYQ
jgi:hypothetical protein